ncbi:sugar ABC transporter permease [Streptomyces sp. HC44]|uniref:Sugar ABC transporter permease n=1 Tax=Streptomyces scabichelini TaxID=2711217 RepID=A0A6G4UXX5_9ACTN|nr:sugar ABC transporter permease [Streptomyces scabichelini]NGO06525.1 sugar ABC transporter permease [Streptomyces scabichelini]
MASATHVAERPPRWARAAAADRRLGWLLLAPTLVILLAVTAFPLAYNLWNSVRHVELADPTADGFAGLGNYREVFADPAFRQALVRTLVYTAVSVFTQMIAGLVVALVLHRPFRGRGWVRAAVLVPWAVPTVVGATSWKTMLDPQTGFVNQALSALHLPGADTNWLGGEWTAWVAIGVTDAWKTVPFVAIILLAGLQVIPDELYEAARIDGASAWQAFWRVTLPLLKPALLVALIFRTLSALLVFDVVFILTGGGPGNTTETLSYINWREFLVETDFGTGGAVSVVLVVLSLLVAAGYVRIFRTDGGDRTDSSREAAR